jgi:FlaG/FlaF family flagellin (archaellin)
MPPARRGTAKAQKRTARTAIRLCRQTVVGALAWIATTAASGNGAAVSLK